MMFFLRKYHSLRFVFLCLLITLGIGSYAQSPQFIFHHLGKEHGLTQASTYFLSKDAKGFLWIGSEDGLLRFDGQHVKKYQSGTEDPNGLLEKRITSSCFEDKAGDLWFSTPQTVHRYRRETDDFESFSIKNGPQGQGTYRAFHADSANIWLQVGTGKKGALYLFNMELKTFERSVPIQGEHCVLVQHKNDHSNQYLFSTRLPSTSGLIYTDLGSGQTKKVEFEYTNTGVKRTFPSPTRRLCYDQNDDCMWVGVYNGLGRYLIGQDSGTIEIERIETIPDDFGWVQSICVLNEQYLLAATDKGLLLFDKQKNRFVKQYLFRPESPYSLQLQRVNRVFLDEDSILWISNSQQELAYSHLDKFKFPRVEILEGLSIKTITEGPERRIWCSTVDSGVYVFNQEKELLFQSKNLINKSRKSGSNQLPAIAFFLKDLDSQWWGNLGNYFFRWSSADQSFNIKASYFLGVGSTAMSRINYCYQDSDSTQLAARGASLYRLFLSEEKVDTLAWHNLEYLQLGIISFIFKDARNRLFLGDNEGRLVIFEDHGKRIKQLADISNTGTIYALLEDDEGNFLAATSNGLGKIDADSLRFQLLSNEHGIPNEAFYAIERDTSGQLWLPGNDGLIRYNPLTQKHHRFHTADGLLSPVFSPNATLTASQSSEIWVGGKNGVNVFNENEVHLLKNQPEVILSHMWVNDEIFQFNSNLNELEEAEFEYENNTLSFQFAAMDFADPEAVRYTCQMLNYDQSPVPLGERNFIRYANLPKGSYVFQVWATNSDGVLNKVPFELPITIIPPFYQQWWFYISVMLMCALIIFSIFRYRLEQALKLERLRVKLSSDLHDDVGAMLSGLAMQSELLEMTADDDTKPKLSRIAEMSRHAMARMRDTVWAIDARKDKFEDLLDRMREHAEEILAPKAVDYRIESESINLNSQLTTGIRQNIYLIYKEAITNIGKHSNANEVLVHLKKKGKLIEMRIYDNGSSKPKQSKFTGQGLANMRMRAQQIGATIDIKQDDGFEIILSLNNKASKKSG